MDELETIYGTEQISTILIVDDLKENINYLKDSLLVAKDKFKIVSAENGKDGCEIALFLLPDLIIMDWHMPVMNGIEAVNLLKTNELTANIPIFITTGVMVKPRDLQTALENGAVDYIRKPIDRIELLAKIRSALKLSRSMDEIKRQQKELKRLNESKDLMLTIISHDLRTPIGNLNVILDEILSSDNQLNINDIKNKLYNYKEATASTSSMIQNLLEWARSQYGEINWCPDYIDIQSIISDCVLEQKSFLQIKNVDIQVHIPEEFIAFADKNMVKVILRNIILNAIKFSHKNSKIRIDGSNYENYIELRVTDFGIGMKKELYETINNQNFLLQRKEKTRNLATGMGLFLCSEFVKRNFGEFSIESTENVQTKIQFTLPKADNDL